MAKVGYGTYIGLTASIDTTFLSARMIRLDSGTIFVVWSELYDETPVNLFRIRARVLTVEGTAFTLGPELVIATGVSAMVGEPFPMINDFIVVPMLSENMSDPLAYVLKFNWVDSSITSVGNIPNGDFVPNATNLPIGFGTIANITDGENACGLLWGSQMCWITNDGTDFIAVKQAHTGDSLALRTSLLAGYDYYGDGWAARNLITGDGKYWSVDSLTNTIEFVQQDTLPNYDSATITGGIAYDNLIDDGTYHYLYAEDVSGTFAVATIDSASTVVRNLDHVGTAQPFGSLGVFESDSIIDDGNSQPYVLVGTEFVHYDPITGYIDTETIASLGGWGTVDPSYGTKMIALNNDIIVAMFCTLDSVFLITKSMYGLVTGTEPVILPDGPLWWAGVTDGWVSAYVWDGSAWQACRMTDGTTWWDGPDL